MEFQNRFQNKLKKIKNLFSQLIDVSNDITVSIKLLLFEHIARLYNFSCGTIGLTRFKNFDSNEK